MPDSLVISEAELRPLDFVVIGAGQVVRKYWIPASRKGLVKIVKIVGLESREIVLHKLGEDGWNYERTNGIDQTVDIIRNTLATGEINLALVIPPRDRLDLLEAIIAAKLRTKIFLEKPYADNYEDLERYRKLIETEWGQYLHFAGKYANGRADILYEQLPAGELPDTIELSLIEGSDYYRYVIERIQKEGTHPFIQVGPELDLAFHLLDIVETWGRKYGKTSWKLIDACDLSTINGDFDLGFGVEASLIFKIGDKEITIKLRAGKGDVPNQRFVLFKYPQARYWQEYTSGVAVDPVYCEIADIQTELAKHDEEYNYYAQELKRGRFARQSKDEQLASLEITELCIDMQKQRIKG